MKSLLIEKVQWQARALLEACGGTAEAAALRHALAELDTCIRERAQ